MTDKKTAAARRQAKYREAQKSVGAARLNLFIDKRAAEALDCLSVRCCISKRLLIERLILDEYTRVFINKS